MAKSKVRNLDQLLASSLGPVEVVDQETTLLTAPGEHYGSIMLALEVTIKKPGEATQEKLPLVAKLLPANAMLRLAFDTQVTFKKEVLAYTKSVPAMVELQKEYHVNPDKYQDKLFPKCFGARISLDENSNLVGDDAVLIFDNLKREGFFTEDRLKGFDLTATRVILKDLAQFHAVPIALKLLKPEEFEEKIRPALVNNKGLEQLPPEVGMAFHNAILEGAREVPELTEFLPRLQEICDEQMVRPYSTSQGKPNEPWGTMSHSDFWVSNTMILKDSDGNTVKNKIVDLQLMRYQSNCRDLTFFLFTSVINSVLEEHFDEFLRLYHTSFVDTLKSFGGKIDLEQFSWDNFRAELDLIAPMEAFHILVMLKPICTERGKVQNSLEDFKDTDWSRKDLLGPNHRRKLKDTVLALNKRGWL